MQLSRIADGTGCPVSGTATLSVANGVARRELSKDVPLGNPPGPVLHVNATNSPNTGQTLRIDVRRSRTGAQRDAFQVPTNASYHNIIIWCDPFDAPIAEASIQPTP